MTAVDLDNTDGCPVGVRCESCGTEAGPLAVETASAARLGVMCLTLCRRCAAFDGRIAVSVSTTARLVGQHCGHLGIDLDQMAAAMEERERPRQGHGDRDADRQAGPG
jgi:hypothetical protein